MAQAQRQWTVRAVLLLAVCGTAAPARGITLTQQSQATPWPGVTWKHYKLANPKGNARVAFVDLCATGVHVGSRKAPGSLASAGSFGASAGAQLVTNGDFYKTGPIRVYGQAVGDGVPWPLVQTGVDPGYSDQWYYKDYGFIAFLHDGVQFQHSKWVKNNWPGGVTSGWKPGSVVTTVPPGTLALVSGFSELVVEGTQVTCSSPTADDCFPDRSDMRARHPRTAMGLTEDMQTFILAVVDGRTAANLGVYGTELASLMFQVGAWQAFNLDGGGSSQMWVKGQGYVNDYNGNNLGNGARAMANHWAIFAGSNGQPQRPGSCVAIEPCGVLGPGGGVVDNEDPCFATFGPAEYWRTESVGYGGSLRWTNAFQAAQPGNWAWWRLDFEEAGTYTLEYRTHGQFGVYSATEYHVRHKGADTTFFSDQSAGSGWVELGELEFKAGGEQWVAVVDNVAGAVASNQHIVADAVRLTRVGPWCGDGQCDEASEDCAGCETDCGACPFCGDGSCGGDEDCGSCATDCGVCPFCGDGSCGADEDCASCAADCGVCPFCGDGSCGGDEDCGSCAADCGACEPGPEPDPPEAEPLEAEPLGSVEPVESVEVDVDVDDATTGAAPDGNSGDVAAAADAGLPPRADGGRGASDVGRRDDLGRDRSPDAGALDRIGGAQEAGAGDPGAGRGSGRPPSLGTSMSTGTASHRRTGGCRGGASPASAWILALLVWLWARGRGPAAGGPRLGHRQVHGALGGGRSLSGLVSRPAGPSRRGSSSP